MALRATEALYRAPLSSTTPRRSTGCAFSASIAFAGESG